MIPSAAEHPPRVLFLLPLIIGLAGVAATIATAADDTALRLTNVDAGNTGYVRVPDSDAFSLQTFTIEAWVQRIGTGYGFTTDPSGNTIVAIPREGMSGSNIASWHLYWSNGGQVLFNLVHTVGGSGLYVSTPAATAPLDRHHVAATFDGAAVRLFVDGALAAQAPWSLGSVYYGADDLLIGASNFGLGYLRRIDGLVDDVRLWDHARTESEIATYRNCRLTGGEAGLVAYWTFDDSDLADETGHGHDGIAQGTAGAVGYASMAALGSCLVDVEPTSSGALQLTASPIPVRDRVTIRFRLSRAGPVVLEWFDVAGRRLPAILSETKDAGWHQVTTDSPRARGIYFLRLCAGGETRTRVVPVIH